MRVPFLGQAGNGKRKPSMRLGAWQRRAPPARFLCDTHKGHEARACVSRTGGYKGGEGHARCTSMHARCTPDVRRDVRWLIWAPPFALVAVPERALRQDGTAGRIVRCEFSCSRTDDAWRQRGPSCLARRLWPLVLR
jgi:hypothetical protein